MGHDLVIIIVQNIYFIGLYAIDINIIHLFVLFKYRYCAHCLDINIIYLFLLFTCFSYTQLLCLNNT